MMSAAVASMSSLAVRRLEVDGDPGLALGDLSEDGIAAEFRERPNIGRRMGGAQFTQRGV
jgi:hypothetical protein